MRQQLRAAVVSFSFFAAVSLQAAELTCPSATTLDALATCIRGQMPGTGSNGFVAPTATEQADWRTTVRQMLAGQCGFALPASLAANAQLRTFTDSANGKSYCLLMEVLDANNNGVVDRGWGTFIVDANAERELSQQAPHPISDSTTENQAIGVFKGTSSRSYLMAGAHRNANGTSSCQSSYGSADAAHNVANMFHATNAELIAHYGTGSWTAIQWHGMAADTCSTVDAYLSHGRNVAPLSTDKIVELKNKMLAYHPTWKVQTPGTGACSLNATDNTQGRLINGVDPALVCGTSAASYSGEFIHIEQDPGFRTAADWVASVNETWPAGGASAPAAPASLGATAGNAQVSLTWTASSGATSYRVHRATTNGGPYGAIASNLTSTSYTDSSVTNGTTYYYVTTASNATGESAYSNQAVATPSAPSLPAAPANLTALAGKRKITLSWSAAAGATSYNVKRATVSGGPYSTIATGVTSTTYTNSGTTTGTTYYYVVTSVNASGESASSNQAAATSK